MNPKRFLENTGKIFLFIGALSFIPGLIGSEPQDSIFGSAWWFSDMESWAYLILGFLAIFSPLMQLKRDRGYIVLSICSWENFKIAFFILEDFIWYFKMAKEFFNNEMICLYYSISIVLGEV